MAAMTFSRSHGPPGHDGRFCSVTPKNGLPVFTSTIMGFFGEAGEIGAVGPEKISDFLSTFFFRGYEQLTKRV